MVPYPISTRKWRGGIIPTTLLHTENQVTKICHEPGSRCKHLRLTKIAESFGEFPCKLQFMSKKCISCVETFKNFWLVSNFLSKHFVRLQERERADIDFRGHGGHVTLMK